MRVQTKFNWLLVDNCWNWVMGTCCPFTWNFGVFHKYSVTPSHGSVFPWQAVSGEKILWVSEVVKEGAPDRGRRIHLIKDKYWSVTTNKKPSLFHLKYNACIFHVLNKDGFIACVLFLYTFLEVIALFISLSTSYSRTKTFLSFHRTNASKRGTYACILLQVDEQLSPEIFLERESEEVNKSTENS